MPDAPPVDDPASPPALTENDAKYVVGPGQGVSRNGQYAALSKQEFTIFQAIKWCESLPLGDLVRTSYDDAVWNERYNRDDKQQADKIRNAISRLGEADRPENFP